MAVLFTLLTSWAQGQISISDDFSDGNFSANPAWQGDTGHFDINAGELQLNRSVPQTDTSILVLNSRVADSAQWTFYFRFTENLTGSNYARVYLISNQAQLRGSLQGYFLEMSAGSSDELKLIRQDGFSETVLIRSASGYLGGNQTDLRVRVSRNRNHQWEVEADTGTVIDPLQSLGTASDSTFRQSTYFGVFCRYTSTRSDKFFFDDFSIQGLPFQDREPPRIVSVEAPYIDSLTLNFDEPLQAAAAATNSNYTVDQGIGNPVTATYNPATQQVKLRFLAAWQPGLRYRITASNLSDTAGNSATMLDSFTVSNSPPALQRVQVSDSLTLQVFFTEPVRSGPASNLNFYQLLPATGLQSVQQLKADQTELRLSSALLPDSSYQLIVRNISDDFGYQVTDTAHFNSSQLQLFDDFSDGNFSQNPPWRGDTGDYRVNANLELQLDADTVAPRYLSTASTIMVDAAWQFDLRLDFNPSSQNLAQVYLASEDSVLSGAVNGYYVLIGGSDDEVSLFRQDGNSERPLVRSGADLVDTDPVELSVRVLRSADARWGLYVNTGAPDRFVLMGTAVDSAYRSSFYFGIRSSFTSSRADRVFFDNINISGLPFTDKVAPKLDTLQVVDVQSLRLVFNESVTPSSAENINHYGLDQALGMPVSARLDSTNPRVVRLRWSGAFSNRTTYNLSVNGPSDRFGNVTRTNRSFTFLQAVPGDLIINELLPDPSPVIGLPPNVLPEVEYLELLNRSGLTLDLADFRMEVGSSSARLPSYRLPADSAVILSSDSSLFDRSLPTLEIDISSSALLNSGTRVSLYSPEGLLLQTLEYDNTWYRNSDKDNGGWALERIDPDNICEGAANWTASIDPSGGTPGRPNSVRAANPDTTAPSITALLLPDDNRLELQLSEQTDAALLQNPALYRIEPALPLDSVRVDEPGIQVVELFFSGALALGQIYHLHLTEDLKDCAGNRLPRDTFRFALPQIPDSGDVLINEILFNPLPGGEDFVELYNASDKVLDLRQLRLGNWNTLGQSPENIKEIDREGRLFFPKTYLALSSDISFLREEYRIRAPENLLETAESLPSMSDAEGSIALLSSNFTTLDYFEYEDDYHLALLDDDEGVSLERISLAAPTQDPNNWQSAAQAAGFATPGYQNSQFRVDGAATARLSLEPRVFSPNQDGYHDFVQIRYQLGQHDIVGSVYIYHPNGTLVRQVVNSENFAPNGFVTWDGLDDNGQRAGVGIYIVVLDYFAESGAKGILKATCVLSL